MFAAVGAFAGTLFETTFATEDEFKLWTVVNANNDECTWVYSEDATPSKVYYSYSWTEQADDWLISPAITPEEDGTLMVEYVFYGNSYGEAVEVRYGSAATVEAMTNVGAEYPSILGEETTGYFLMEAKAGEAVHLAFHATTPADRWRLYLLSVKVSTVSNPVDLKVSEIVSPVSGEALDKETVTVRVENVGMVDVEKYDVAFDIDGTNVARETVDKPLAKGESAEYTFTAKADLSSPRKNYTIKAYTIHADDIMTPNDTAATSVRHIAPATVPYTMGFEPTEDDMSDLKFYNVNEDSGDWGLEVASFFMNLARTGVGCLAYNYDKENSGDDWAMLDPINVEPGYYVLKFWYSGDDNHAEKLAVYYGNEATPEAMTNKVVEYAPFVHGPYQESISVLHFDKAQTVCLGFHAFSDKDENWICVDDISFDKIDNESVDLLIADISNPSAFHRSQNKQDLIFEVRNVGIIDATATVKVTDGEVTLHEGNIDVKAQEFKTVTVENLLAGLAAGSHTLKVELTCEADNNADNNTMSKDVVVLGEPVKLWDFEDGQTPGEFTFRVEDEGTLSPDADDFLNEEGWGVLPLGATHYMLGDYTLVGTSWLDGTDKADRWLVLPKVSVTGGNSYFVWNANSINEYYLESYKVMVCDGEDVWYNYTKEAEITAEGLVPATRGISLAKYEGKEVNVAINIVTKIGDLLVLDNLGFYGDVAYTSTGISDVRTARGGAVLAGDVFRGGDGAESIVVRDASGRTVGVAAGSEVSVASLAPGMYIATVSAGGTQTSYKFVKR